MGTGGNLAQHSASQAWRDLRAFYKAHTPISLFGLVMALLALPVGALVLGATVHDLGTELTQIIVGSVLTPVVLLSIAYFYFLARAPNRLYATRIGELRELRTRVGLSTADLDPTPAKSGRFRQFYQQYFAFILLAEAILLVFAVGLLGYSTYSALNLATRAVVSSQKLRYERDIVIRAAVLVCAHTDKTMVDVCKTLKKEALLLDEERKRNH